jgi:hypothetical protein
MSRVWNYMCHIHNFCTGTSRGMPNFNHGVSFSYSYVPYMPLWVFSVPVHKDRIRGNLLYSRYRTGTVKN